MSTHVRSPEHSQGLAIEVLGSPDHGCGTVCRLNCDSKTFSSPSLGGNWRHFCSRRLSALWLLCFTCAGYKHSYLLTYSPEWEKRKILKIQLIIINTCRKHCTSVTVPTLAAAAVTGPSVSRWSSLLADMISRLSSRRPGMMSRLSSRRRSESLCRRSRDAWRSCSFLSYKTHITHKTTYTGCGLKAWPNI